MFSDFFNPTVADSVVNIQQTTLAVMRRLTHLDIFGDVIYSEHGFGDIIGNPGFYSGKTLIQVSYTWGFIAYPLQLFGYIGGLLFNFFFGVVISYFFFLIKRRGFMGYNVAIIVALFFHSWVSTFGIDNTLDRYERYFVALLFIGGLFILFRRTNHPNPDV